MERIDDGARRMADLVTELMDLTLLETGRMALQITKISPTDLIDRVVASHGPMGDNPAHEIVIAVDTDAPDLSIDVPKVERALGNVLVNAQKFTPAGGTVRIACRVDCGAVVFEIEDTGEGIDPEEIPYIFERFYKSHRSSGDRTGFGLGLAITKNIIELHQGSVNATSTIGEGSRFSIRLPIS